MKKYLSRSFEIGRILFDYLRLRVIKLINGIIFRKDEIELVILILQGKRRWQDLCLNYCKY